MLGKVDNIPNNVKMFLAILVAVLMSALVALALGLLNWFLKQNLFSIREFFNLI